MRRRRRRRGRRRRQRRCRGRRRRGRRGRRRSPTHGEEGEQEQESHQAATLAQPRTDRLAGSLPRGCTGARRPLPQQQPAGAALEEHHRRRGAVPPAIASRRCLVCARLTTIQRRPCFAVSLFGSQWCERTASKPKKSHQEVVSRTLQRRAGVRRRGGRRAVCSVREHVRPDGAGVVVARRDLRVRHVWREDGGLAGPVVTPALCERGVRPDAAIVVVARRDLLGHVWRDGALPFVGPAAGIRSSCPPALCERVVRPDAAGVPGARRDLRVGHVWRDGALAIV